MKKKFTILIFVLFSVDILYAMPLQVPNYDPFKNTQVILKQKVKRDIIPKSQRYTLYGIFGEKVNINGTFYSLGDRVQGCEISNINKEGVVLKCKHGFKNLYFLQKKIYEKVEK